MAILCGGLVFLVLLARPAYMAFLRRRLEASDPRAWDALPTNGSFRLLVPQLFCTRYHDEALYAAHAHQILIHGLPYDPYWKEDRRGLSSWIHDCLSHYLLAAFALVCGGDLNRGWIAAVAAIGALWFALFHAVLLWASGREAVAVPLALFSVFFADLYAWLLDLNLDPATVKARYAAVFAQRGGEVRPHFQRLPSGFLSGLLLAALLLAAWRLSGAPTLARGLLVGAGFGFMVLVHPFEYAFGLGTLLVFTAFSAALGSEAAVVSALAAACALAVAAGLVYCVIMWLETDAETRAESMEIMGRERTRRFVRAAVVHAVVGAAAVALYGSDGRPGARRAWLLLAAAQAAAFLGRNAQVVLGWTIQPFHLIPLASLAGSFVVLLPLAGWLGARAWWTPAVGAAAAAAVLAWALYGEKEGAEANFRLFGLPRDMEEAMDWVRANTPKDAVFLSLSMAVNKTLPIYTEAKVLVPPPVPNMVAPFGKRKYLSHVAQLLRTCRADVERFLSERLLLPRERQAVIDRLNEAQRLGRDPDLAAFEQADWLYPYYSILPLDSDRLDVPDAPVLATRQTLRGLCAEVAPLSPPFFLWIDDRDRGLFRERPESFGGRLAFRNASVSVYGFVAPSANMG